MAATPIFDVEPREKTGSAECRRLRREGRCPGNLYGGGKDTYAFSVSQDRIRQLLTAGAQVVDLQREGKTQKALVQELQWDTFSTEVLHVDLVRVRAGQRVQVEISIHLRGNAAGVLAGGVLEQPVHSIEIECFALQIPEAIELNINDMEIGDGVTVAELPIPENVEVLTPGNLTVVHVIEPTELEEEEALEGADAGPIEPEVIGKSDAEDED